MRVLLSIISIVLVALSWTPRGFSSSYEILAESEQAPSTFVQGLFHKDGVTFISSGLYGKSYIKRKTSESEKLYRLPKNLFAEGLTVIDDRVFALTWKAGKLLQLNANNLELTNTRSYQGEGWGLTHDEHSFYMSNGSHYIQQRDLQDFALQKYLRVTYKGKPLSKLNELEFQNGHIWANVWFSNNIYKIDPKSGEVVGVWDLSDLVNSLQLSRSQAVLNGIAYDAKRDAFWITGKLWPKRFLVRLSEKLVKSQK